MIVRTTKEWGKALRKVHESIDPIEGTPIFAWDTETRDNGYPDIAVVGFSLAWYEKNGTKGGCYVPVGHSTGEMQLPIESVQDGLAEILEDRDSRTVMHNAPYDLLISRLFPCPIEVHENIDDTMVMAWLLNTNGIGSADQIETGNGLKGLKDLSLFYFGHKMQELTALAPKEINPKTGKKDFLRVDKVPIEKLGPYAWDDGIQTLNLRELFWYGYDEYARRYPQGVRVLSQRFRDLLGDVMVGMQGLPKLRSYYERVEREFAFALKDMNEFGVPLDVGAIEDMQGTVAVERRNLGGEMFSARPGQDAEPWGDPERVKACALEYDRLNERYENPPEHPDYPKKADGKPKGKGGARKELFQTFDLSGTWVEDKIRDDGLRAAVIEHPELVHKVFNLNSTPKLQDIFFSECECPVLGHTDTGQPSTAGEYIEEWAAMQYPVAKEMLRYREIDKLYGTYMVGMPRQRGSDGRIRTRFGRVRTGRLSSASPNLQNIPTSEEFPIRKAFLATGILSSTYEILEWHLDDNGKQLKPRRIRVVAVPGNDEGFDGGWEVYEGRVTHWWGKNPPWVMMVADYGQLEICLLAHLSKDPILIEAVRDGQDVHALTARAVFDEIPNDISLEDVKKFHGKRRKDAKPVNFGVIYGMGPTALANALNISVEEAKVLIEQRYMGYYKGVKVWITGRHTFVCKHGYVELPTGRRRHLPEGLLDPNAPNPKQPGKTNWGRVGAAKRMSQNTPVQGFAADTIGLAMRDVRRWLRSDRLSDLSLMAGQNGELPTGDVMLFRNFARVMLQVHDELVSEFHPAVANDCMDRMVNLMESPGGMKLLVPLTVDAALGANWFDAKA